MLISNVNELTKVIYLLFTFQRGAIPFVGVVSVIPVFPEIDPGQIDGKATLEVYIGIGNGRRSKDRIDIGNDPCNFSRLKSETLI